MVRILPEGTTYTYINPITGKRNQFFIRDGHLFLKVSVPVMRNERQYYEWFDYKLEENGVLNNGNPIDALVEQQLANTDLGQLYIELNNLSQNGFRLPPNSPVKLIPRN